MSFSKYDQLRVLINDAGLTFSDCVQVFADRQNEEDHETVARASDQWTREGEIEVDDNAIVSRGGDRGAYVMAWVWVYDETNDEEEA